MLVTLSGIVTLVRPLHSENARDPMPVTLSGIVTLVRPLQPSNTEAPMPRTPVKSKSPESSDVDESTAQPSTKNTLGIVVLS